MKYWRAFFSQLGIAIAPRRLPPSADTTQVARVARVLLHAFEISEDLLELGIHGGPVLAQITRQVDRRSQPRDVVQRREIGRQRPQQDGPSRRGVFRKEGSREQELVGLQRVRQRSLQCLRRRQRRTRRELLALEPMQFLPQPTANRGFVRRIVAEHVVAFPQQGRDRLPRCFVALLAKTAKLWQQPIPEHCARREQVASRHLAGPSQMLLRFLAPACQRRFAR
jgi:hypothetical protein